jgi:hypothetical protein
MKILKYDVMAIFLSILIFSAFTFFGWNKNGDSPYLLIEDSEGSALYPLSENREIHVHGPVGESVIQIADGKAAFIHSDCIDVLCVQMGPISEPGDWAACLPNEIFISTSGGDSIEVDASDF